MSNLLVFLKSINVKIIIIRYANQNASSNSKLTKQSFVTETCGGKLYYNIIFFMQKGKELHDFDRIITKESKMEGVIMDIFSFGKMEARKLCKWLWILIFLMIFLQKQSLNIGIFEGIPLYYKLKYYVMCFYLRYLEPILLLIILKFFFELVYKFYQKIGNNIGE